MQPVITNLFSGIPVFGEGIVTWLWGNFSVDDAFLNRAFILHWLIAFGIIGVVVFHVIALHITGSNNLFGVRPVDTRDTISLSIYDTKRPIRSSSVSNYICNHVILVAKLSWTSRQLHSADPLVTPVHIVPEWYFLPFYAILRSHSR